MAGVNSERLPRRRRSFTDTMNTDAEKLWSAFQRKLVRFDNIPPILGFMPNGGIGVGPFTDDDKGKKAFYVYINNAKVIARLVAEGFVRSDEGAPHPWHLVKGNGRISPADKAACRSLTNEQRKRIDTNRVAALKRLSRLRVQQDVAALHRELSDDTMIATMDAAIDDHGAHFSDTRPCSICGYGDDAGTIIHCDNCNIPFHDGCVSAPPVAGDWFCTVCQ